MRACTSLQHARPCIDADAAPRGSQLEVCMQHGHRSACDNECLLGERDNSKMTFHKALVHVPETQLLTTRPSPEPPNMAAPTTVSSPAPTSAAASKSSRAKSAHWPGMKQPVSIPRWRAPCTVAQSKSCLERLPVLSAGLTEGNTPRCPRDSRCEYSSHRISSNISMRALQSVPRLTTPSVASGAVNTPSPSAASVKGQMHTPPPAAISWSSSSRVEWVQCTAHSRSRACVGTDWSNRARGVTPCASIQSAISWGCSSRWTWRGNLRRCASAAMCCSAGTSTARSECTTAPKESPRVGSSSNNIWSRSICSQYFSRSEV
eukprot:m.1632353 g.1632353  ORF g.1632353 m.1632353 type:complete len:319 (+) comp25405_c0_seq2:6895-7851(+)